MLQMATSFLVLSMLTATALARLGGPDVNTTGSTNASHGNGTRRNGGESQCFSVILPVPWLLRMRPPQFNNPRMSCDFLVVQMNNFLNVFRNFQVREFDKRNRSFEE